MKDLVPPASGEHEPGEAGYRDPIASGAVDYVRMDVCRPEYIVEFLEEPLPFRPGTRQHVCVPAGGGNPAGTAGVAHGRLAVPDTPSWGVTVDEGVVSGHSLPWDR